MDPKKKWPKATRWLSEGETAASRLSEAYEFYKSVGRTSNVGEWRHDVLRCILEDTGCRCLRSRKGRHYATGLFPIIDSGELLHNQLWGREARERVCAWIDKLRSTMPIDDAISIIVSSRAHPNLSRNAGLITYPSFRQGNDSALFENPWFVQSDRERPGAIAYLRGVYDKYASTIPTRQWVLRKRSTTSSRSVRKSHSDAPPKSMRAVLRFLTPDWPEEFYVPCPPKKKTK